MKEKNPGKTVMVDDSGKAGEPKPESQRETNVAQSPPKGNSNGTVSARS